MPSGDLLKKINDSKKLSHKKREELYKILISLSV
jgi:ribonuclease HII